MNRKEKRRYLKKIKRISSYFTKQYSSRKARQRQRTHLIQVEGIKGLS